MSLSAEATNLASLLLCLTQPDTEAIRNAEQTLKPVLKNPKCVPALFEILFARGTQPEPVRHIAAILLRKRLPKHYPTFPADYKAKTKAEILQFLATETERTVKKGAVGVTVTICEQETSDDDDDAQTETVPWPELFQFIAAASKNANHEARELAFLLLVDLTRIVATYLSPQFQELCQLFQSSIMNEQENINVKKAALRALGELMTLLSEDPKIDIFCSLLPSLIQFAVECQKRNDEDTISVVLDHLYELAYSPSQQIGANMPFIVRFCLGCMADPNLEMNIRDAAALVVASMSENRPKSFGKDKELLSLTLNTIFNLVETSEESGAGALFQSNPAWRDDDDDDDFDPETDGATATTMAQGTLDMMAFVIPKKYIFQPVVEMCFARFQSPDENQRKAGIAGLGVIAEGCAEPFREHLSEIMPIVLQASGDPSASVRECACFALGQMSEHCQPEILSYSSQVLPIAFALLDDTTVTVQATACYVLEMFCERLEPDSVRPFLKLLVEKLVHMLQVTQKRSVQEMSIAALAATAVAAEEEFAPYVEGVAKLMASPMAVTDEKLYSLRGRALECMGYLSIAVGKDGFRPYFADTMRCACEGLSFDSTELHEFAYAAFANLAKAMESEFSPCLPELVPHLLSVINQDDGCLERQAKEQELQSLAYIVKGDFDGLIDDDEDNEEGNIVINVRTALLDSKKGAITAISEIASHCGEAFVPFLNECITVLTKAAGNWHPLIKTEAADALASMIIPIVAAQHGGSVDWKKGDILGASPLSPEATAVASEVLKQLVEMMKDEDKEAVGNACSGVETVINLCGPHALKVVGNGCLEATIALLTKTAPCQIDDHVEGMEDEDESDSFMTSVCDLVAAFGRVMGSHFCQYLPQFLPAICDYAKSSRPPSDRAMAIGCLGELAQELGDGISEYWKQVFLPAVLAGLADEDHNVKRNAAFCGGVCCEGLGASIAADYGQILQLVGPLFNIDPSLSDTSAAAVDNAAACVSRMMMAVPANVPIQQVLPALLNSLPLKNDMSENATVYNCLLNLLQMNNTDALAQKDEIKRIFQVAVGTESKVEDELKQKLNMAIQQL